MDKNFWLQKWEKNEIAFHESEANPVLVKYFERLSLAKGSRVFVPLCGKTLDIAWLLSCDYQVAAAELSATAIEQLFAELGVAPKISSLGELKHYQAPNVDIFVGNIFDVTKEMIGSVNAIYDRAALVALPEVMRSRYSKHLMNITHQAPQLLISYAYDQNKMEGPPFSVINEEVKGHYKDYYDITLLESIDILGGLKGCPAKENVWLLK